MNRKFAFLVSFARVGCGDGTMAGDGGGTDAPSIDADVADAADPCVGQADGADCGGGRICARGRCQASSCGDGYLDPASTEECDDGNTTAFDGCEPDCTFTCEVDANCGDDNPCNGTESCNTSAHLCTAGTDLADGTECTSPAQTDGVCRAGECAPRGCGNGVVESGEDCEDGNTDPGDGCENDCSWTCDDNPACDDGFSCNGFETCNLTSHTCEAGTAPMDGIECTTATMPAGVCRTGACIMAGCGNGVVESATEECDDENTTPGDGCESDCTFTCNGDLDCDDLDVCTGSETCDLGPHTCVAGTPATDGTVCAFGSITDGICLGAACVMAGCGNTFVEAGEDCDDGNAVDGDGCDTDCTYSCEIEADCLDTNLCNGTESCNVTTHTCQAGTALVCNDGDACTADTCDAARGCQASLIDMDGDGHAPLALGACGSDCLDTNPNVYVGAEELCDGIDNNCNAMVDEVAPSWYIDCDRDGYAGSTSGAIQSCTTPTIATPGCSGRWISLRPAGTGTIDCNDGSSAVRPGATEIVGDEADQNCDGREICYADSDDDDYRTTSQVASTDLDCTDPGEARATEPSNDCNDSNMAINPGATETIGDQIDYNCDGRETCYLDADDDGYLVASPATRSSTDTDCTDQYEGRSSDPRTDCNDNNANIRPGALELCNAVDEDCNGAPRNGCPSSSESFGSLAYSVYYGGTTGTAFTDTCPSGEVLIGFTLRSAALVDQITPICRPVQIVESSGSPEYSYRLRWTGADDVQTAHGGTGGAVSLERCPTDEMVIGITGRAGALIDNLGIRCGTVTFTRSGSSWAPVTTYTRTLNTTTGTGGSAFLYSCPSGQVARAVRGYVGGAGPYLAAIALGCSTVGYTPQ